MTSRALNDVDLDILYSSKDHHRLENLFELQTLIMAIAGQYPQKLKTLLPSFLGCFISPLVYLHSVMIISCSIFFIILYLKTTWDAIVTGELGDMCDGLTMALIYFVSCYTTVVVWLSLGSILKLLDFLNQNYRQHSLVGLTFVTFFESYRKAQLVTKVWISSCFISVSIWLITPLILRQHNLPLKCWYPFDVMQPIVYEINYLLQIYGQYDVGTTFGIGSALYMSIIFIILGQFDVLYCSIKNLNFNAKIISGCSIETLRKIQKKLPLGDANELSQYLLLEEQLTDLDVVIGTLTKKKSNKKEYPAALHQSLVECVKTHHFVLKASRDFESIFHPICFAIAMQVMIQLCLLIFAAVMGGHSTMKVFNLIQYFFMTLWNLYIYTYSGELLRQHSIRCSQAFWCSEWAAHEVHLIRKDLLIFLTNSNHVATITAAKFFNIDLLFLRKALTQSFSFFTLLRKIAEKRNGE